MDINQLKQFQAIAKYGSITRAAEALYLSQPTLSTSLANLEKELGCLLFNRIGRKLIITEEGKRLLQYADVIVNTLVKAKESVTDRDNPTIRIYSIYCLVGCLFKDYILREKVKPISIKVVRDDLIADALFSYEADAVISGDYFLKHYSSSTCERLFLFQERLMFSVPLEHRWANKLTISVDEIKDEPIYGYSGDETIGWWVNTLAEKKGYKFNFVYLFDLNTMLQMQNHVNLPRFFSSLCYLLPEIYEAWTMKRHIIKIDDPFTCRDIYMWYLQDNKDKLTELLKVVNNNAAECRRKVEMAMNKF